MALLRKVYRVNCQDGGMNGNLNADAIPSADFIDPSKNFYLFYGGRQKRGGTAHVSSQLLPTGGTKQLGVFEYYATPSVRHTLVHGDDGNLFADYNSTPIYAGLSASLKSWGATFAGKFFITDGSTKPKKWDGAVVSDFTAYAADWGGGNYPAQFIKHGQQASQRLWGAVLSTNKYDLYASGLNVDDFSVGGGGGGVVTVHIDTGDGIGIVGIAQYGERLIAFGKRQAFIIQDLDPSTANWGYQDVQWEGGAAHQYLIIPTQNDLVIMTDDGEIYSATTVINFGDYKAASITRPSYMHTWIQQNLDLTRINQFHAVYNPYMRYVAFFVVRNGFSVVNTALLFWMDRPLAKAWSICDNLNFVSGYGAVCSQVMRPSTGKVQVWTGGYTGYSWKLDQSAIQDDTNPYEAKIYTAPDPFDNGRESKHYTGGQIILSPASNATLSVGYSVDDVDQGTFNVPVVLPGSTFGGANYGTGIYSTIGNIEEVSFNLGAMGQRIQYRFSDNNLGEAIYIAEYRTDFRPQGIQP